MTRSTLTFIGRRLVRFKILRVYEKLVPNIDDTVSAFLTLSYIISAYEVILKNKSEEATHIFIDIPINTLSNYFLPTSIPFKECINRYQNHLYFVYLFQNLPLTISSCSAPKKIFLNQNIFPSIFVNFSQTAQIGWVSFD